MRDHETLERVLTAGPSLRPRIAATLSDQADELRMFRHIATLQDLPFERPPDHQTDRSTGAKAAETLGMNALATRLLES